MNMELVFQVVLWLNKIQAKCLQVRHLAIVATIESGTSVTKNLNMSTNACFINSGRIEFKDSDKLEELGVDVETLAVTSAKSFYRSDLTIEGTSKQSGDEEGSATVGALLTKKIDDDTTSKLIVYSNNMFVTDMQLSIGNNYDCMYINYITTRI